MMDKLLTTRALAKRDMSHGAIAGAVVGAVVATILLAFCVYPCVIRQIYRRRRARLRNDPEAGLSGKTAGLPTGHPDTHRRLSSSDSLKNDGDLSRGIVMGHDEQPAIETIIRNPTTERALAEGQPEIARFALYNGEYMPESAQASDEQPTVLKGTSADYYSRSIPSEAFGMTSSPDEPVEDVNKEEARSPSRGSSLRYNVRQLFRRRTGDATMSSFDSYNNGNTDRSLNGEPVPLNRIITNAPPIASPTELSPTTTNAQDVVGSHTIDGPDGFTTSKLPISPFSEHEAKSSPSPPAQPAPGTVNPMDIMTATTDLEMQHRTERELFASSYDSSQAYQPSPVIPQADVEAMMTPSSLSPAVAPVKSEDATSPESSEPASAVIPEVIMSQDVEMSDSQRTHLVPTDQVNHNRHPSYPSDISSPHMNPPSTNPSSQNTPYSQVDSPSPGSLGSSDFRHSASPQNGLGVPPSRPLYPCEEPGCRQSFDQLHKLKHHQRYHSKQHKCPYDKCNKGFGTKTHLSRHINDRHEKTKKFHCSHPMCEYSREGGKAFPRKDNWKRHMLKIHHMDAASLPEPIEVDHEMAGT